VAEKDQPEDKSNEDEDETEATSQVMLGSVK